MATARKHIQSVGVLTPTTQIILTAVPAEPDSIEKIKADAERLKTRLQALSKKEVREAPIRTADLPKAIAEALDSCLARLAELANRRREIKSEEDTIKDDLRTFMDQYGASAIEAPTGRYCAEPKSAYVSVVEATIAYTPRF